MATSRAQDHDAMEIEGNGHSNQTQTSGITYEIPNYSVIGVEHPCIINDSAQLQAALGGRERIAKLISADNVEPARAYLRPNQPMSRPLYSKMVNAEDVLLKVTVPKLLGRRRKQRPSSNSVPEADQMDEMQDAQAVRSTMPDSGRLLQALRDNSQNYTIEPVGSIDKIHRFREMADYQYSVSSTVFMDRVRSHLTTLDLQRIKSFKINDPDIDQPPDEMIPPPFFAMQQLPFYYNYEQNPAMMLTTDGAGKPSISVRDKHISPMTTVSPLFEDIPMGPINLAFPEHELDEVSQKVLAAGRKLLEERPIWTRRALHNFLGINKTSDMSKRVLPYLGFSVRAGAWRDTVVRFGVNPKSDPSYRQYQSISFLSFYEEAPVMKQIGNRKGKRLEKEIDPGQSHIFDGRTVSLDSKTWQICDITDPFLKALAINAPIAEKCDLVTGWYNNGGLAKIKQVMRHKITSILEESGDIVTDISLQFIHDVPDIIEPLKPGERDENNPGSGRNPPLGGGDPQKQLEMQLATSIRSVARQDVKNSVAIEKGVRFIGLSRYHADAGVRE